MRQVVKVLTGIAVLGAVFFGCAGTLVWWNAWLFVLMVLGIGLLTYRAIGHSEGLAEERRSAAARAPRWDRMVVILTNLAMPAMAILAGIGFRTRWLPAIPDRVSAVAFCMLLPASILTYRSMTANAFFSSHIRIQTDRGHVVVSEGPYRFLRHPGYAGAIAFNVLAPVALGSWLALVPGMAAAALLAWRTAREDRILVKDLSGYSEYSDRVRYRLVPGVW